MLICLIIPIYISNKRYFTISISTSVNIRINFFQVPMKIKKNALLTPMIINKAIANNTMYIVQEFYNF